MDAFSQEGVSLPDRVRAGLADSLARLENGYIVWGSQQYVTEYGLPPERALVRFHEQWWDGEKVATRWFGDSIYSVPTQSGGKNHLVKPGGAKTAFDGTRFYRESHNPGDRSIAISSVPSYLRENWFLDVIPNLDFIYANVLRMSEEPGVELNWSIVGEGDESRIILELLDSHNDSKLTYQFDPNRGFFMDKSNHGSGNKIVTEIGIELSEVAPDVWFPISSESVWYEDEQLIQRTVLTLDLERSKFNDPSGLPDEGFTLSVQPGARISGLETYSDLFRLYMTGGLDNRSLQELVEGWEAGRGFLGNSNSASTISPNATGYPRNSTIYIMVAVGVIGIALVVLGAIVRMKRQY